MFKKYMDVAMLNKMIAKQRKLAQSNPESGYSAIISGLLEQEAKNTFKNFPEYTRKKINDFFAECVEKFRQTELVRESCKDKAKEIDDGSVVLIAVLQQAVMCDNLTIEEARLYDFDTLIKILVNLKLLPKRCLNDCKFDMRVA